MVLGPKRYERFASIAEDREVPEEMVRLEGVTKGTPIEVFFEALGLDCKRLQVAVRTLRLVTTESLTKVTKKDLLNQPNIGRKVLNKIIGGLAAMGLSLKEE